MAARPRSLHPGPEVSKGRVIRPAQAGPGGQPRAWRASSSVHLMLVARRRIGYAGRPLPCPSSHSTQHVPIPLKHLIRASLPHLHVNVGNNLAALAAGMSWFLAAAAG